MPATPRHASRPATPESRGCARRETRRGCGRRSTRRWGGPRPADPGRSVEEVGQATAARRVAHLAQGLGLDLTDALTGHPEAAAPLVERARMAVDEPEAQLDHAPLPGRERVEDVFDLDTQHRARGRVLWPD